MLKTDSEAVVLESLDFDPCCEGKAERDCSSAGTPASYIIHDACPCGRIWLACEFHRDRRMGIVDTGRAITCAACFQIFPSQPPLSITPL